MFEFVWWWCLLFLPLPLLFYFLPATQQAPSAALRVPRITPGLSAQKPPLKGNKVRLLIASLAWLALVLAAARPQWLGEPVSVPSQGRDLMLAVDLSGSMKINDMQVNGSQANRLQMIKSVLADFIQRRVGDRLGLLLFADTAYLQAPLTYDRDTVEKLLNESVIGLVGEKTAIGDAIGLAVKRFERKEESNRVLILLTDGQNTAGNISPKQAKQLAVEHGIKVYTIGVGADSMLVRSLFGSRRVNPSQDLDEDMLTDIADATGGMYFRARDTAELEQIYVTLDTLEPIVQESRQMRPLQALFYYPLSLALLLTLLLAILPLLSAIKVKKHD